MTTPLLNALVAQLQNELKQAGFRHDLSTPISPTTNLMHGTGGIFGAAGISRDVFSTRIKPSGLNAVLPAIPSNDDRPVVAYLTGFTDEDAGSEKSAVCDVPIAAGDIKSCLQGSTFGRVERKTDVLEINKIGRRTNRGEFLDLRLINDPVSESSFGIPGIAPGDASAAIAGREVLARFLTLGVAFERKLGPMVYTGNPANDTSGGYAEFLGLELLVGTGKFDVITNQACAALDSYVRNMNYANVTDGTIVKRLTTMYRYLSDIARRTGLAPVEWAFVMRRNLFDELADLWPCAYATYRCAPENTTVGRVLVDGMAQKQMADEIRNGLYLLIDGVKIPVIIDDFLPEKTNTSGPAQVVSGCFASDIYLLPLTVRGGIVSTYWEYFDFTNSNGTMQAVSDGQLTPFYWTDGGRFLFTHRITGWCVEWWAKIEPRLRLLTPHLAGRLQNVLYCPLDHFREDDPDSGYFFDGGAVSRSNAPYDVGDLYD